MKILKKIFKNKNMEKENKKEEIVEAKETEKTFSKAEQLAHKMILNHIGNDEVKFQAILKALDVLETDETMALIGLNEVEEEVEELNSEDEKVKEDISKHGKDEPKIGSETKDDAEKEVKEDQEEKKDEDKKDDLKISWAYEKLK